MHCFAGSCKVSSQKMCIEIEKDLNRFIDKTSCTESQFLKFNESEYHIFENRTEEIVPSSDSNSESENFSVSTECLCNQYQSLPSDEDKCVNKRDTFLDYVPIKCSTCYYEDSDAINGSTYLDDLLLEPLLSVDTLQANVPSVDTLVGKLKVFSILDPFDTVESSLNCLRKKEQSPIHFEVSKSFHQNSNIDDLSSFMPYKSTTFELSEDFIDQPCDVSAHAIKATADFLSKSIDLRLNDVSNFHFFQCTVSSFALF